MNYLKLLWNLYGMKRNTKKTTDQIRILQEKKLRRILAFAYEHSAYYHRTFEDAGITHETIGTASLSVFPAIDKAEFLANFDELITVDGNHQRLHVGNAVSVFGRGIYFRLAFRQLVAGKRRYVGAVVVAALLVFFASLVGRMDTWLGADGKGMMDAFNPADHDIGVQVFGNLTIEEAEAVVRSYTDITDTYLLAMPGVAETRNTLFPVSIPVQTIWVGMWE